MAETVYRVATPDGSVMEIAGPAGASDDQIAAYAASQYKPKKEAPFEVGKMSPPEGLSAPARFMMGMPNLLQNSFLGAKQMLGIGDPAKLDADIRAQRQVLDPIAHSGAGLAGNIVGGAASLAPTMLIPGSATIPGAAAIGGVTGAMQPTQGGESRLVNTAVGAGVSAAGQGAANLIGRALRPVQAELGPEAQRALGVLDQAGVPTNVAQRTGSKAMANVNAALDNLPTTAGPQQALREAQQQAFNRAVGKQFGADVPAITDDVITQYRQTIGNEIGNVFARNKLDTNATPLLNDLAQFERQVSSFEVPDNARILKNYVDALLSKVDKNGVIDGTAVRKLDSELGKRAWNSSGDLSAQLHNLQTIVRDAMDQSMGATDQAAVRAARDAYKNLMTIAKNAERSPVGDVNPATLLTSVRSNPSTADLQELAKAGKAILPSRVGDSGTGQRLMYQGLLTGSTLGGGLMSGQDPETVMGLTAASLLGPRAAQMVINSPAAQRWLTQGYLQSGAPAQLGTVGAQMLRTAPLGLLNYRPE